MSNSLVQTILEKYENVIKENCEQRKTINILVDLLQKSVEKIDNTTKKYEKVIDDMKSSLAQIEIAQTQLLENQERIVNSKLAHVKKEIQKIKSSLHDSKNQYDSVNENIAAMKNTCIMRNTIADYPLLFDQKTIIRNLLQYNCQNYYIDCNKKNDNFVLLSYNLRIEIYNLELLAKQFKFKLIEATKQDKKEIVMVDDCPTFHIKYKRDDKGFEEKHAIGFDANSFIKLIIPILTHNERECIWLKLSKILGSTWFKSCIPADVKIVCDYIKSTL